MPIKIVGLDRFAAKLNQLKTEVVPTVKSGVDKATIMVEGRAKMLCPTNRYRAGGELRQSIHPETQIQGDQVIGKVSTIKEYAAFVEFGTGIKGQVSNRNKKVSLAYRQTPWVYTPDDGETFYHTIGNVAQPYLYPALHQNKKEIRQLVIDSVKGLIH